MAPRPKILLVDDQDPNLIALEALLRRDDAEVLRARSGSEGLELLLAHDVAVAIVDVQMPDMDGFELAELMRGTARTREVPIIFVTAGLHDQARIFRGYESGAVDFLYKPIDGRVLRGKVDVFLKLWRQRELLGEQVEELRRAEERLKEADRRKDEFLGVLSHELRNPLAPIQNGIYILRRAEPGSPKAANAIDIIARQCTHLERLVGDLLDVTRIARGKIQLARARVDLREEVRRTAEDYRPGFVAKEVVLHVATPPEPVWIDADPTRIAQAVGNLLGNALKFSGRGAVALSVEAGGGAAIVRVRDQGVGIAPDLLGRIFEPFTQADRTLDRSQGGLGLGLALVKGMVELHGGSVSAASDGPGRGATFTIHLPLADARPAEARPHPIDGAAVRRRRVLVVEDNADTASTMRLALELLGHEVHVTGDGNVGVALARRLSPDVVVCDIGLPGMDGYEVARKLRVLRPAPVLIAVTGYALPEDQRRAREAGFVHHLAKPIAVEELGRIISAA